MCRLRNGKSEMELCQKKKTRGNLHKGKEKAEHTGRSSAMTEVESTQAGDVDVAAPLRHVKRKRWRMPSRLMVGRNGFANSVRSLMCGRGGVGKEDRKSESQEAEIKEFRAQLEHCRKQSGEAAQGV